MARRATKDTFGFERTGLQPGDETEVRRQYFAGQAIPDHIRVEDSGAVEEIDGPPVSGLGAAPHSYKHQLDEHGQLKEEHRENATEEKARKGSRSSKAAAAQAGETEDGE